MRRMALNHSIVWEVFDFQTSVSLVKKFYFGKFKKCREQNNDEPLCTQIQQISTIGLHFPHPPYYFEANPAQPIISSENIPSALFFVHRVLPEARCWVESGGSKG